MLHILFWVALVGAIFSYFIYPILLCLIPVRRSLKTGEALNTLPSVSLIVTAHNEAHRIRKKIDNTLEIDYPGIELIIASDASADATDEIVLSFEAQGIILSRTEQRLGKEYAQKNAISKASGDILVFSDVATQIPPDAVVRLVDYFKNSEIGAVSSEDVFISRDGALVGEGAYVKYEMWLRKLESLRGGLVGLSGSFFAARRKVCDEWDIYSPSDFNTALNSARQGLVAVSAPDVLGYYQDVADASKEYPRKVRTIIRGLTALSRHPEVLNPFRFGCFAFQVFGHKLMRWAAPWFQALLLALSFALAGESVIYSLALMLQLAFYGCAVAGHIAPRLRRHLLIKIPYFFVQVNIAVAHATVSFLSGRRMTVWSPSQR